MNENKLSFANQNLVVDYISFNISGLRHTEPIANYLFNFGFNSILKSNEKTKGDILISDNRNCYSVTFVKSKYDPVSKSYWDGIVVRFSGDGILHRLSKTGRKTQCVWYPRDISFKNA